MPLLPLANRRAAIRVLGCADLAAAGSALALRQLLERDGKLTQAALESLDPGCRPPDCRVAQGNHLQLVLEADDSRSPSATCSAITSITSAETVPIRAAKSWVTTSKDR